MELRFDRRMLYTPVFHIDTNLINARQKLPEVNQLEDWYRNDVILINMSGTAYVEAQADGNELRVKKATQQIYTVDSVDQVVEDEALLDKVSLALFEGGAHTDNQKNDARIVCTAIKYHATLVTNDGGSRTQPGGILGNRDKIRAFADVRILSPAEAVAFVRTKLDERDTRNEEIARMTGMRLPEWTRKD